MMQPDLGRYKARVMAEMACPPHHYLMRWRYQTRCL
jgi:hypothetical protein